MRLADFILSNIEPILVEWEDFARCTEPGRHLNRVALRDHAKQILHTIARDMTSYQTAADRLNKAKGESIDVPANDALDHASDLHAENRLELGFDIVELMGEYRALRTSVLSLWRHDAPAADERDLDDVTRFNESIDQSLTKAVTGYTTRVDQARNMFLAILSHDLRNPLSTIAMTAELVPHLGSDPAEVLESSRQISRSVDMMNRMIRDMLDYTSTHLGAGMPVQPVPLDLAALGEELHKDFQVAHPGRVIEYHTEGDLHGRWDGDRVRQAISNLVGNALQHGSDKLPVILSIRGEASSVLIDVKNGGKPISAEDLPKIYEPLVRGCGPGSHHENCPRSIGLGLYIAREVVKAHDGQLGVISTADTGTTFTIRLPREPKSA